MIRSSLLMMVVVGMVGCAVGQRSETKTAIMYRLDSDNWKLCTHLHGSTQHDKRGWYCAIEKARLHCLPPMFHINVLGAGSVDGNSIEGYEEPAVCTMQGIGCWTNLTIDGVKMPNNPCPKAKP